MMDLADISVLLTAIFHESGDFAPSPIFVDYNSDAFAAVHRLVGGSGALGGPLPRRGVCK